MIKRRKFTPEEDKFLSENYLSIPTKRLSKILGRGETSARQRLAILGLTVPPEVIEVFRRDSFIKKGATAWNKGKKQDEYMSEEAIVRSKATRFQKGNLPHNSYNQPGKITIRKDTKTGIYYQYICLELSKWVPLHTHLWQQHHGKIPSGMCLWFKDGNSLNVNISNLELITRKENRLRNSASFLLKDQYVANAIAWRNKELKDELIKNHPELIELKREQLKLKRKINESIRN